MSCVNERCNQDPLSVLGSIVVNTDGDMACCPACKAEYERQRDHFFNTIVHNPKKCEAWLRGGPAT